MGTYSTVVMELCSGAPYGCMGTYATVVMELCSWAPYGCMGTYATVVMEMPYFWIFQLVHIEIISTELITCPIYLHLHLKLTYLPFMNVSNVFTVTHKVNMFAIHVCPMYLQSHLKSALFAIHAYTYDRVKLNCPEFKECIHSYIH